MWGVGAYSQDVLLKDAVSVKVLDLPPGLYEAIGLPCSKPFGYPACGSQGGSVVHASVCAVEPSLIRGVVHAPRLFVIHAVMSEASGVRFDG